MKHRLTAIMVLALAAGGTIPAFGQPLEESELRGENIRLREEPADDAVELAVLQGGEEVDVTGEPVLVEGHAWWPVTVVDSEDEGWVRWEFLEGATSAADPAPTEEPVDDEPLEEERPRRDATDPANDEPEVEEPAGNRQGGGSRQNQAGADRASRDAEPTEEPASEEPDRQNRRDRAEDEATAEQMVEPESEPTPEATPTVEPQPTVEPDVASDEPTGEGSETDPYPFGSTGTVGDWEVRVTEFRRDATEVVLDADDANERPGQGEQYALVGIDLTNTGSRQASANALVFGVIGDSGDPYPAGGCGRIPEELDLEERVPAGDERSGDICFVIAAEDAGSLALFVSEPLVPGQDPVWFALRNE